jgi:hypothetical protein
VTRAAYLAAEGFEAELAEDLRRAGAGVSAWHGRLALSPDPPVAAPWALDVWTDPREIEVPSVKAGADALRAIQRNWAPTPCASPPRRADGGAPAAGEGAAAGVSRTGADRASRRLDAARPGPDAGRARPRPAPS